MDKPAKLSGLSRPAPGPAPGPAAPPRQQAEPAQPAPPTTPPYRIICNSEHFIVLNPIQRRKPQPPYRPDEGHPDSASPSSRFQAKLEATREKGRILRPRQ